MMPARNICFRYISRRSLSGGRGRLNRSNACKPRLNQAESAGARLARRSALPDRLVRSLVDVADQGARRKFDPEPNRSAGTAPFIAAHRSGGVNIIDVHIASKTFEAFD